MGTTKNGVIGQCVPHSTVARERTAGPLGWKDAGDPGALACLPGDTPGPVGTCADAAALMCGPPPPVCQLDVPVISVDIDRMKRLLYTVAYAEAAEAAATRGFGSAEVSLGDERAIETAARAAAERLLEELYQAIEQGPASLATFVRTQEARRERARAGLQKKLDDALRAGRRWTNTFGWTIKGLSALKFGSTVTIKVASLFTGGAGAAVDIVYSGTKAGVEASLSDKNSSEVRGVVTEETVKNLEQEAAETLNELVASGLMTQAEKNKWDGVLGNAKGDYRKLSERIQKLSKQVEKTLESGSTGKRLVKLTERHAKAVAKLKALPVSTAKTMLKKNAAGLAKKTAGRALSLVFLQSEVREAWNELRQEWRASN